MPADPGYLEYVLEQLEGAGNLTTRRLFGGYGIYESGAIFALILSDSSLYFKVDDETRPNYQAIGSQQFENMPYWLVPADVLDDRETLLEWAEEAIAVGHAAAEKA